MVIRDVKISDLAEISRLFYETVHQVNIQDYSAEQLVAWAPSVYAPSYWQERFENMQVYIAEDLGQVVGFAELETNGHIDCFYVHHQRQRCGVGTRLMAQLELDARAQSIPRLFSEVSLTACPFFERQGFKIERQLERLYRGVEFKQFLMAKLLIDPEASRDLKLSPLELQIEALLQGGSNNDLALLWASEADYPWALCSWKAQGSVPLTATELLALTGHATNAVVKETDFLSFFEPATRRQDWYGEEEEAIAKQYGQLVQLLQTELSDLQVFQVGERELDIYILGHTSELQLVGITTKAVET